MKNQSFVFLLLASICITWLATPSRAEAQQTSPAAPKAAQEKTSKQTKPQTAPKKFDLTFDDLKFDMEKGSPFSRKLLTPKINEYHNSTVKLRGYIRPSFTQTGLSKFIFVRDNKECCFGPGAAIFDCVLVRLEAGLETDFTVRPISIEGKFSLKEYKGPDGNVWSIYRMTDAKVK